MGKIFILIILWKYGHAGAMAAPEFSSAEACEAAAAKFLSDWERAGWRRTNAFTVCVAKGAEASNG